MHSGEGEGTRDVAWLPICVDDNPFDVDQPAWQNGVRASPISQLRPLPGWVGAVGWSYLFDGFVKFTIRSLSLSLIG